MAYVVTRPCRIGSTVREPGYVLTVEDMRGRDLRHMEDVDRSVRFDPSVPDPQADEARKPRGRGKAAAEDESSSED